MTTNTYDPPLDPLPDPGPDGPGVPGDDRPRAERCACGAPATWEVSFSTDPHYEYFCDAHLPPGYMATPIAWPANLCTHCDSPHFTWACPEIGDAGAPAIYDTVDIIRLWSASRALLTIKLARLTAPQLLCQAIDFAAWLNEQTKAGLPATSVLRIWEQLLADGDDRGLALERAA